MKSFSTVCEELTAEEWESVISSQVGLVVPSAYYQLLAFDWDNSFEEWYPLHLDTRANLKQANLQVRCIFEPAGASDSRDKTTFLFGSGAQTYPLPVLPRAKRISAPFWWKILQFIDNGGNLSISVAHDYWIVDWEDTFGITIDVRFGLPALPGADEVSFSVVADRFQQQEGDSCTIPVTMWANVETSRTETGSFEFELDRKGVFIGQLRAASQDGKISVSNSGARDTRRAVRVSRTG